MKNFFFLLLTASFMTGCDHSNDQTASTAAPASHVFGESFDTTGTITQAEMITQVTGADTIPVKFVASIVETCAHAGCWMTVENGSGIPMYVYMKDHDFAVPLGGCKDLKCVVNGLAYHDTLSVELLKHFAEDANKSQAEIDAITEPMVAIAVTASGVMIHGYTEPEGGEATSEEENEHGEHEGHEGHEHGEEAKPASN